MLDAPSRGGFEVYYRLLRHNLEFVQLIESKFGRDLAREALFHIILDLEQYRKKGRKLIR